MTAARRRVLVTGATGFIGRAVCRHLAPIADVVAAVRNEPAEALAVTEVARVGDIRTADWRRALRGVDAVIHCAARVHVMREREADPLAEFRRTNVDATRRLAEAARGAGVGRFVYVSSIKVNGEQTSRERPFRADDTPRPEDPYGVSKLEAEQVVRAIATEPMEAVVVRPPLVYGPGVGGNFRTLLQAVKRGLPLPLGSIDNRRSLVAVDNLASFLAYSATTERRLDPVYLIADGEDLSTPELLRRVGAALDRRARLLPMPAFLLRSLAAVTGQQGAYERLAGSLILDVSPARASGWKPVVDVDEALVRLAREPAC